MQNSDDLCGIIILPALFAQANFFKHIFLKHAGTTRSEASFPLAVKGHVSLPLLTNGRIPTQS